MKLIIAVVRTSDEKELLDELFSRGLTATKLASTGDFLNRGIPLCSLVCPTKRQRKWWN